MSIYNLAALALIGMSPATAATLEEGHASRTRKSGEALDAPTLGDPAARVLEQTRRCWCAASDDLLPLDCAIGVGIGYAAVTRDGSPVYERDGGEFESLITVAEAEALARLAPDRDWRIHLVSLLEDRHYRREAPGRWKLYKRGYGLS